MEFRIAPLFIAVLNLLFLLFVLYNVQYSQATLSVKMVLLPLVFIFVARGAYKRHDYYTKAFSTTFSIIQLLNVVALVLLLFYFIPTITA